MSYTLELPSHPLNDHPKTARHSSLFSDVTQRQQQRTAQRRADHLTIQTVYKTLVDIEANSSELQIWLQDCLQKHKKNMTLSSTEHAALVALYHNLVFTPAKHELHQSLKALLISSHQKITGQKDNTIDICCQRLPSKSVKHLSSEARLFYEAVYRKEAPHVHSHLRDILRAYGPGKKGFLMIALCLVFLAVFCVRSHSTIYVIAPVLGLFLTSYLEYIFHRYGTHSKALVKSFEGYWLGERFHYLFSNHSIVHHGKTYTHRSYTQRFKSEQHKHEVDALIFKMGGQEYFNDLSQNGYGMNLLLKEYLGLVLPVLPLSIILAWALGFDLLTGSLFLAPSLFYPSGVSFVHHYLHMTLPEVEHATKKKPFIRWLLSTRYGALMAGGSSQTSLPMEYEFQSLIFARRYPI